MSYLGIDTSALHAGIAGLKKTSPSAAGDASLAASTAGSASEIESDFASAKASYASVVTRVASGDEGAAKPSRANYVGLVSTSGLYSSSYLLLLYYYYCCHYHNYS